VFLLLLGVCRLKEAIKEPQSTLEDKERRQRELLQVGALLPSLLCQKLYPQARQGHACG
jgi:hypothetical protein